MAQGWASSLLDGQDVLVVEAIGILLEQPRLPVVLCSVEVEQVLEVGIVVVAVLPPEVLVAQLLVEAVLVPGTLDLEDEDKLLGNKPRSYLCQNFIAPQSTYTIVRHIISDYMGFTSRRSRFNGAIGIVSVARDTLFVPIAHLLKTAPMTLQL